MGISSVRTPPLWIGGSDMPYEIDFGEYFLYDELTRHLHGLAAAYPRLAHLQSIGKSWRERDIWCMTLTNPETGPHH